MTSQAPVTEKLAAVVMAGGLGTRMKSETPKHLHGLLGRRVVDWVLDAAAATGADPLVVVASPGTEGVYDGATVAVQQRPLGTGDAVAAARRALDGFAGSVLVLDAAAPLLTPELLRELVHEHRRQDAAVTILTVEPETPLPYGRILRDESGAVRAIVEEKDASPEERQLRELNSSTYVFDAAALWESLGGLEPSNEQGELYLTDTIARIVDAGGRAAAYRSPDPLAPLGINNRVELAVAAAGLRDRINEQHMLAGVTIVDPATTWIEAGVELEPDVVIQPFTVLRGTTSVERGAQIGPHVVAWDSAIGPGALVGPFCYLRPGTVLGAHSKAGTFVEVKNSSLGEGAKVPHLSYIGDAEIGDDTNIGAGNITANLPPHPGAAKERTKIGRNVKTSIHTSFIAPVEIGDDSWTAAGSVISEDVPPESLAGFPPRQVTKEGYVRRHRDD
jgi:bifunctional UDP-N-acetylglucosamine pyrophosphorylase / glucosamine-1-phosphate N-acetyltransferase